MAALAELPDYPFVNQLNSPTLDGGPDNNKWFNCVVCSLLSAILYFRPEVRGKIEPDDMKDAVYGANYANDGTDAARFVPYVAQFGLKLYSIQDMPGRLVEGAHQLIRQGQPAIFTEIDPYCTDAQRAAGWTHVCSFFKEIDGGLCAMDPFGGKLIELSDGKWAQKLVGNTLWTMTKEAEDMPKTIDLTMPEVAHYFELANNEGTQWRSRVAVNGKQSIIQFGILDAYRRYGGDALCGLTYLGLPMSGEIPLAGIPGAVKQVFERGVLVYDPAHKLDNPPGSGSVYAAHLYNGGPGQDPRVAALQGQVTQLQQQAGTGTADEALVAQIRKLVG